MAVNKLDITMMEDVGTSANQLLQRDGSGNIPAVDGSQVIGLSEFTTSTSDPVITTNPSGGVGSLWYNKTSGEMYVCTTATAGANVWVGEYAGFGGTVTSYSSGGVTYRVHTFLTSGTFTTTYALSVDYLVVAGGGGGDLRLHQRQSDRGDAGELTPPGQSTSATRPRAFAS